MVQTGDAPIRATTTRKSVKLIRKAHHLRLDTKPLQRHEYLFSLLDRAAQIKFVVDYLGRSPGVADVGNG